MNSGRLWLLAHQDDEVLGLHLNSNSFVNHVIYLTDGVRRGATYNSSKRVSEAQAAWNQIDKNAEVIFFGTDHALKDGTLCEEFSPFHLTEPIKISLKRDIKEIVSLQLEGGHQDHDIVSMLAEELAFRLSLDLYIFPACRALHNKYPFMQLCLRPINQLKSRAYQSSCDSVLQNNH
jgi:hypothetical protein